MFSPYYAWAGRRDPHNHVAVNIGLYGPRANRWTMTERRRSALDHARDHIRIGPSGLAWDGNGLSVNLDETTVPIPGRVKGTIRLHPHAVTDYRIKLDTKGRHDWWPIAPHGRVEVDLQSPDLRWSGNGYFDTNAGTEPLEAGFSRWDWSRAEAPDGATMLYDVTARDGNDRSLAVLVRPDGSAEEFEAPPRAKLPSTLWRVARGTQADPGHAPRVVRTLEDTPFYARSLLESRLRGQTMPAMHESLNLDRFASPVVKLMLPFRMPRTFW